MTPEELKTFCKEHGGQHVVAATLGYTRAYINRLCSGKDKITDKTIRIIRLTYPI